MNIFILALVILLAVYVVPFHLIIVALLVALIVKALD